MTKVGAIRKAQFVDAVFDERGPEVLSRQSDGVRRGGGPIFAKPVRLDVPVLCPRFLGHAAGETNG
jgi:hypothetical protein